MSSIHCVEHGEFGATWSADESGNRANNIDSALDRRIVNRQLRYTQLMDIETPKVLKLLSTSGQALSRPNWRLLQ